MPIVKFKLLKDENGIRRIYPPDFSGGIYTKIVKGERIYYGYVSEEVLNSIDEDKRQEMEMVIISTLDDLFNEVGDLLKYDDNGNIRTDDIIRNLIMRDLLRFSITIDDNGNLVE